MDRLCYMQHQKNHYCLDFFFRSELALIRLCLCWLLSAEISSVSKSFELTQEQLVIWVKIETERRLIILATETNSISIKLGLFDCNKRLKEIFFSKHQKRKIILSLFGGEIGKQLLTVVTFYFNCVFHVPQFRNLIIVSLFSCVIKGHEK